MPALLFHRLGHGGRKLVRTRARNRLVAEAADAIELGLLEPIQQEAEVRFALAGKADDEGRADGQIRAYLTPAGDAPQYLLLRRRPAHAAQHRGRGVLEWDIEVGQHLAVRHQRDDLVHMRVRINVV